jgi:hypothetical protein
MHKDYISCRNDGNIVKNNNKTSALEVILMKQFNHRKQEQNYGW